MSDKEFTGTLGLKSCLIKTEFLSLWDVEHTEVMHVVSLKTLVRRRLYYKCDVVNPNNWPNEAEVLSPFEDLGFQSAFQQANFIVHNLLF